jgi:hypothetical protein
MRCVIVVVLAQTVERNLDARIQLGRAEVDHQSSSFDRVIALMTELNSRFKSTQCAKKIFLRRLNNATTASQWEAFLVSSQNRAVSRRRHVYKPPSREQLLVS